MGAKKKTTKPKSSAKLKGQQANAEALEKPLDSSIASTEAPTNEKKSKRQTKSNKPKRTSALDAAAKVLGENGARMHCKEMIDAMAATGYWKSANGQTPSATLYSAISREIKHKGKQSRFAKAERGKFELAE